MESQFESMVSFFFRSPEDAPKTLQESNFSNLYLLRRDIFTCFGIDPNTGIKLEPAFKALWPGVMAIMAGIDLLGKFSEGDTIQVGTRFRKYVEKYIDKHQVNELYQLRCSIIHTFGLYSMDKGRIYRFFLGGTQKNGQLIQQYENNVYGVDIYLLRQQFEESISKFEQTIRSDEYPTHRFVQMLEKYGSIRIGPPVAFL